MPKRTAVVDIGSNSIRLIIYERTSRYAFHILHEEKNHVRIGSGAYLNSGYLQESPMQEAIETLYDFISVTKSFGVRKTLVIATSAMRDAPNKREFIKRVKKELNLNIKIVTGEEEANLGAIACANLLPRMSGVTVDIGGGSTELAVIEDGRITNQISLDLGTVRIKELFYDGEDIDGAKEHVQRSLKTLPDAFCQEKAITIGGTLRALTKSIIKRNGYPLNKVHSFNYSLEDEGDFIEELLNGSVKTLKSYGIKKERLDVIQPGLLIFHSLVKKLKTSEIVSSGVGIREGIFLSNLLHNSANSLPVNFNPSLRSLQDRFDNRPKFSAAMKQLSIKLFNILEKRLNLPYRHKFELGLAALLANIGTALNYYGYHRHGLYIVLSNLQYQLTHQQITLIGALVRFHKKDRINEAFFQEYKELLPDRKTLEELTAILAFAKILLSDRDISTSYDFELKGNQLVIFTKSTSILVERKLKTIENLTSLTLTLKSVAQS